MAKSRQQTTSPTSDEPADLPLMNRAMAPSQLRRKAADSTCEDGRSWARGPTWHMSMGARLPWIRSDVVWGPTTQGPKAKPGGAKNRTYRWHAMAAIVCDECGAEFAERIGDANHRMSRCNGTFCSRLCAMGNKALRARQADGVRRSYDDADRLERARENLRSIKTRPEVLAKKSAALKAAWGTPEKRAEKSAYFTERWQDEAFRAKVAEAHAVAMATPSHKANKSAAVKAWMADPVTKANWAASQAAAMARPATLAKRWQTMKDRGVFGTSAPEERLYVALAAFDANTERQAKVGRWFMDFYVPRIGAYIQLDGEYWHGIDRPIIEIAEAAATSPQALGIWKAFCKDIRQNEWCAANGLRLIRITDKEFIALEQRGLVEDWLAALLVSERSAA